MAKVISGAHSQFVVGRFGYIIFSRYKGINRACIKYKVKNPKSDKQLKIRAAYTILHKYWNYAVSHEWKNDFERIALVMRMNLEGTMSGFNVFMKYALKKYTETCFPDRYPGLFELTKPADEFIYFWGCLPL